MICGLVRVVGLLKRAMLQAGAALCNSKASFLAGYRLDESRSKADAALKNAGCKIGLRAYFLSQLDPETLRPRKQA